MSVFDDLSLAMIPSGFKDGKLYSVIPSDGSGDFTFSRGTNLAATRINEQGLIEKGRENLLLQSNQFDTTWTTTGASTPTGGQSGYDGSSDAWLLEATSTSARVVQNNTTSGVQTFSCYAKAGTANYIAFYNITSGSVPRAWFNLSNGTIQNSLNNIDAKIESLSNGWYRCSLTYNATLSNVRIYVAVTAGTFSDTTSGDNIYIQDAQLEQGLVATDVIETTTTTAQAGILEDMPRLNYDGGATCPSLLLEPQRQNLVTYSEYIDGISGISKVGSSIDTNVTTSPEGLLNASLLKEDSSNGSHFFYKDFTLTSGSTYTISIFAKSNGENRNLRLLGPSTFWSTSFSGIFDLTNGTATGGTIDNYGNGWYRCSVTGIPSSATGRLIVYSLLNTATSYQGDGSSGVYLYGFQLEEGSYATSYIPTHETSVTRSADTIETKDITNIITGDSFTWFLDFGDWQGSDSSKNELEISSSNNIKIQVRVRADGYRFYYFNIQGGTQFPAGGSTTANKFCVSYDGQNYRLYRDGVKVATTSSVGDTGWNEFSNRGGLGSSATTPLKAMTIFDNALSDQECIDLTS